MNDMLYICGGYHFHKGFSRNLACKNEQGKVKYCNKMGYARSCLGLGGAFNLLAALGGKDEQGNLKTYERYDTLKDKWTFEASMLVARTQPGVC